MAYDSYSTHRPRRKSDYENPAWSIIVFVAAFVTSLIISAWLDTHYEGIDRAVRQWVERQDFS